MDQKKYKQHLTVWIIVTIVLVAISFYAGDIHGQAASKASLASRYGAGTSRTGGAGGASRFGTGGGVVTGSVLDKDATSITVQSKDGSSKIILYSGSTSIGKTTAGTADDISVGSQVTVAGTQNPDGSITAESIQIRPAGSTMPGAGQGTTTTNASAPMIPAQ